MEWTVINRLDTVGAKKMKRIKHEYDQCWLRKKSEFVPTFAGYAVLVDTTSERKRLVCSTASGGRVRSAWITLPVPQL
jgi:hypothetical protein